MMGDTYDVDAEAGVPAGEGESWAEAADRLRRYGRDEQDWHYCVCGARFRTRRAALRCCSESARGNQ